MVGFTNRKMVEIEEGGHFEAVRHPDDNRWTIRYDAAPNDDTISNESELDIHKKIVEMSDDIRNPQWERDCPVCGRHLMRKHHAGPVHCECGAFTWR